jgi:hypothetical protein
MPRSSCPTRRERPRRCARSRALVDGHAGLLAALALFAGLALACDGPVGPIPGGALRGEAKNCPTAWTAFATEREVEFEVSPSRPRSVRIWNVVLEGRLYVPGDFLTPIKTWPHRVVADPRVKLRIAGQLFRCRALRVEDAATIEALRREAARKYDLEPDGWAARSEVWWFAIEPRTAEADSDRDAAPPDAVRASGAP